MKTVYIAFVSVLLIVIINFPSFAQDAIQIEYGQLIIDQLDNITPTLTYSFEAKAGDVISISLRSDDFDPYLILQDSNFQVIEENDDLALVINQNAYIWDYVLPIDGIFYIQVGGNSYHNSTIAFGGQFNLGLDGDNLYHQPPFVALASSDDYYAMALETYGLGVYEETVAALNRAIELSPKDVKLYDLRSLAYEELGHELLAQADLDRTIEIDPTYIDIYENRMLSYLIKNDYTSYLKVREKILLLSPTISILSEDYRLEINQIHFISQIPNTTPINNGYLIMDIKLHNYSHEPWCITKFNFPALFDGTDIFPEKLYQIQQALYPDILTYPAGDQNNPKCLQFLETWETFVAYDLKPEIEELSLRLITPTQSVDYTLWLNLLYDQTYNYMLYRIENRNQIEINDIRAVATRPTVEQLLDSQVISVENCFGTDTRQTTVSFSQTLTREIRVEENSYTQTAIRAGIRLPLMALPIIFLNRAIGVSFDARNVSSESTIKIDAEINSIIGSVNETLSASAGTNTNFEVNWYLVSLAGEMEVAIKGQDFTIPFFINDRIRSEVKSLPQTPCPFPTE